MSHRRPRQSTLGRWLAGVEVLPASYRGMPAVAVGYRQTMPDGKGGKVSFRSVMAIVDRPGSVPSCLAALWPDGEDLARVLDRLPDRAMAGEQATRMAYRAAVEGERNGLPFVMGAEGPVRKELAAHVATAIAGAMREAGFGQHVTRGLAVISGRVLERGYEPGIHLVRDDAAGERVRAFAEAWPVLAELAGRPAVALAHGGDVRVEDLRPGMTVALALRIEALGVEAALSGGIDGSTFLDFVATVLPLDWFPADAARAEALGKVVRVVTACALRGDPNVPVGEIADMVRSSRGDWVAFWERCRAGEPDDPGAPENVGTMVADLAGAFAKHVVMPFLARAGTVETGDDGSNEGYLRAMSAAMSACYGDKSIPARAEAARWWHDHLAEVRDAVPDEADEAPPWRGLGGPVTVGGLTIRPLTSAGQLADEGRDGPDADGVGGLDHCVHSYRREAALGECHILSVREGTGDGGFRRVATAEVSFDDRRVLRLRQLRGKGNAEAPEAAAKAVEAYLAMPHAYVAPRKPSFGDEVRETCGYDWRDDALVARAAAAYAPFLPRWMRGLGIDELAAALGVGGTDVSPVP